MGPAILVLLVGTAVQGASSADTAAAFPRTTPDGDIQTVWADRDDAPLFEKSSGATVVGRAAFLDPFIVCGDEAGRLLLAKAGERQSCEPARWVGWIGAGSLLERMEADKTGTNVFRKALIINDWKKKDVASFYTLLRGPAARFREASKRAKLFEILFIYKEVTSDEPSQDHYYLLGAAQGMRFSRDAPAVIVGWLRKERAVEWNTREAIEVDKESFQSRRPGARDGRPVVFFNDPQDLLKEKDPTVESLDPLLRGGSRLAWVEDGRQAAAWPHYLTRFPLLKRDDNLVPGTTAYQALIVSDEFVLEKGGKKRTQSREDLEKKERDFDAARLGLGEVSLVFVVDGTGSMFHHGAAAASVVEKMLAGLCDGSSGCHLRAGAVIYRDYFKDCPTQEPEAFPLVQPPFEQLAAFVRPAPLGGKATYNCGHDDPMIWHGLSKAARLLDEGRGSGDFRVIVHIGDMADSDPDKGGYGRDKAFLDMSNAGVNGLYTYAVAGKERDPRYVKLWKAMEEKKKEMDALVRDESAGLRAARPPIGMLMFGETPAAEVARAVIRNVNESLAQRSKVQTAAWYENLLEPGCEYCVVGAATMMAMLRKAKIDIADLVRAREGRSFQLVDFAWVRQQNAKGQSQVLHRVLLEDTTLNMLNVVLMKALGHEHWDPRSLESIWREALRAVLGERDADWKKVLDESRGPGDFILKYLGIVVRKDGILGMSWDDLKRLPKSKVDGEWDRVCRRYLHLRDWFSGWMPGPIPAPDQCSLAAPSGETRREVYTTMNGSRITWLPAELLP